MEKYILNKEDLETWIGRMWLRLGKNSGLM